VSAVVAAVDWGGTWLRAALARDGELLARARQPRPAGFDEQCDLACDLVGRLGTELGQPARALAVGIAGVVRGGRVASASNLGLGAPVDLARRLRERCGIPVTVVNDTQAAAVAEAATLGPGTAVLLTVGTGVGGAIVSGGRLVLGEGAAGDFGHMVIDAGGPACACGGRGCLEQLVSGRVLDETARELAATEASPRLAERLAAGAAAAGAAAQGRLHAGDLDEAARAGDPAALAALERAAAMLAAGLRSVTAAADPAVIVLGGGLMAPDRLLPRLVAERWLGRRPAWSPAELRLARLGTDAGLHGAAILAARLAGSHDTVG
jgi:glucokinase